MESTLLIGDRAYSSWSLRGWLMFDAFSIPCRTVRTRMYSPVFAEALAEFPPARTVPVMRCPDGTVVAESLAIAEELATRHPAAGHWPAESPARATARMLAAEMHAGFTALRGACPMNLRVAVTGHDAPEAVRGDLARLEALWSHARGVSGAEGPWLFGAYCAADAFFAPVAARIATYGLEVGAEAARYVEAHLAHPSFRRWRAMALVDGPDQPAYALEGPRRPWPGPAPRAARAVEAGPAENARCPYSGAPVTHFLEMDGRIFGFCNPFCRDKTLADPLAWPAFRRLVDAPAETPR